MIYNVFIREINILGVYKLQLYYFTVLIFDTLTITEILSGRKIPSSLLMSPECALEHMKSLMRIYEQEGVALTLVAYDEVHCISTWYTYFFVNNLSISILDCKLQ